MGKAGILVLVLPQDLVDATVNVDVEFDATTQLYTYTYEVETRKSRRYWLD